MELIEECQMAADDSDLFKTSLRTLSTEGYGRCTGDF